MLRVLLAGGGTSGHINPAVAIAEIIKKHHPDAEFCFAGTPTGIEAKIVRELGYRFEEIDVHGFQRSFSFENIKRNLKAVKCLMFAGGRAKKIIKEFQPNLVIGTGGYVSGPIVRAAAKMKIKTAIHEQNAYPGVTTRILSKLVDKVMLTVIEAKEYLEDGIDYTVTGLPVRAAFASKDRAQAKRELGFDENEICILSTGGSLGAWVLNENVAKLLKWEQENAVCVNHIHSYGTHESNKDFIAKLEESGVTVDGYNRFIIKDYLDMPTCMAAADIVISRCGANALTELQALGRASILIPSPNVAGNHQYHNGMVLQNAGAGIVIEEKNLTENTLIDTVKELCDNKERIYELSQAARRLYIEDTDERVYNALYQLIVEVTKS
ncbi:MAG: undecaprenyldiphospho-muramoylpentapeptide beta-N-acetylglucosaminyltransferase [Oscillospiraceae bacterium]|nr:undecaprenyldiphospho-muramoylpentapeptide beta-N-acetylglucosaminyltransferase [Oscillospiraceae bacterium]